MSLRQLAHILTLIPPSIIGDLDLERHGYKVFPMGPYYQAWPDGRSLKLHADDADRNHQEISRFSKRDADAMPRWDAWLGGLAAVLGRCSWRARPGSAPAAGRTCASCCGWRGATGASTCAPSATRPG
jgi:phytoene dehydrogenase-like protein